LQFLSLARFRMLKTWRLWACKMSLHFRQRQRDGRSRFGQGIRCCRAGLGRGADDRLAGVQMGYGHNLDDICAKIGPSR